ncbi:gp30 [Listeria phage A511]|uniref:Gp30 n=1 Tax=Listeria phage A511 TaxID=2908169 RepID=A8AT54_BPA51|nr:gp30 [Listeria phage A511]AAY53001.1 gp30 [Listeria phage A511]
MDFKDRTYEELLTKVRNNREVTRKDLSTALWLYEKEKAENKRLKSTVKEETNIKDE